MLLVSYRGFPVFQQVGRMAYILAMKFVLILMTMSALSVLICRMCDIEIWAHFVAD